MTDPTPTPADLERAREWLEASRLCVMSCMEWDLDAHDDPDQVASLATLLRSVREEGAKGVLIDLQGAGCQCNGPGMRVQPCRWCSEVRPHFVKALGRLRPTP